jgi:hypothetical protein
MARLTITLSDERHRALREAAVQRGKTIGQLIEESLQFYGIKSARSADELVAKARARASLTEAQALRLAVAETRAARRR